MLNQGSVWLHSSNTWHRFSTAPFCHQQDHCHWHASVSFPLLFGKGEEKVLWAWSVPFPLLLSRKTSFENCLPEIGRWGEAGNSVQIYNHLQERDWPSWSNRENGRYLLKLKQETVLGSTFRKGRCSGGPGRRSWPLNVLVHFGEPRPTRCSCRQGLEPAEQRKAVTFFILTCSISQHPARAWPVLVEY